MAFIEICGLERVASVPAVDHVTFATIGADLAQALIDREVADEESALEAQGRAWEAVRAMAGRRATTLADLRAKARAVCFAFEDELEGDATDARLLRSLLADIETLAL